MAKHAHSLVYDAALDYIISNANSMRVCSADILTTGVPNYSKVTGSAALTGAIAVASGDFTKQNGAVSGRRATVAQKLDIPVTATGTAEYICLVSTAASRVLWVTECVSQSLVAANNVTIPTWDIEFRDPV